MGFFSKEKPAGLPGSSHRDDDYNPKNKEVFEKLKEEPGYNTMADLLNKKIEAGETVDRYIEDEIFKKLDELEAEYYDLRSRPEIQDYLEKDAALHDFESKTKELRKEIEQAIKEGSVAIDYKDNIMKLRHAEDAIKKLREKIGKTDTETTGRVERMMDLEQREVNLNKALKEKYGNQDLKNENGTYRN